MKINYKYDINQLVKVADEKPSIDGLDKDSIDFINKLYDKNHQEFIFIVKGRGFIEYEDGTIKKIYDCWFSDTTDGVGINTFEESELNRV